jgi:hypothetical protein
MNLPVPLLHHQQYRKYAALFNDVVNNALVSGGGNFEHLSLQGNQRNGLTSAHFTC